MKMRTDHRITLIGSLLFLGALPGCPTPTPGDGIDDGSDTTRPVPKGSACAQIAIGCFDELARVSADSIRFRPISRWPRTTLTWRFANLQPDLDIDAQIAAAERAFSQWSDASALVFKRVQDASDITISFEEGNHGDSFNFDDEDGNIGHAFMPSTDRAGQIHLDFHKNWALAPGANQEDLFTVLLHEIGHALGLDHSLNPQAVMAPDYPVAGLTELTEDDINDIQRFYGSADGTVLPYDPMLEPPSAPPNLTNPDDPDTDGDGIPDTYEIFVYGTDHTKRDTDGDGVDDYTELFVNRTLPTGAGLDSDGDGLPDSLEAQLGTNPNNPDSDADGIPDGIEVFSGTNPNNPDTDGDGCSDREDSFPSNSARQGIDCLECTTNADCDDGDVCTLDICAIRIGVCTNVPKVCHPSTQCDEVKGVCVCPPDAVCDDTDDDEVPDVEDNCPENGNPEQNDFDGDAIGDVCDADDDNDGFKDDEDPDANNLDDPGNFSTIEAILENPIVRNAIDTFRAADFEFPTHTEGMVPDLSGRYQWPRGSGVFVATGDGSSVGNRFVGGTQVWRRVDDGQYIIEDFEDDGTNITSTGFMDAMVRGTERSYTQYSTFSNACTTGLNIYRFYLVLIESGMIDAANGDRVDVHQMVINVASRGVLNSECRDRFAGDGEQFGGWSVVRIPRIERTD